MGIFDFFKKLIQEKEVEETVPVKLTFSEIGDWMEKKKGENGEREKEILDIVKNKIRGFNSELEEKVLLLKKFDVGSKKAEDRIKGVVEDSRKQYIIAVKTLMSNLGDLKDTHFSDLTRKIDKIFFYFNKASFKNYERTTLLIGKEMADIKNTFKDFSKDLLELFNNNKDIVEIFSKINSIKEKLELLSPIEKSLISIDETSVQLSEKISQKENENERLLFKIEKIKQEKHYKERLERKKKISSLEEEIKKTILELKQLIDFKALANFFHINEEQMKMVKDYKENFHLNFEKDFGIGIIGLLEEARLETGLFLEKMNFITLKKKEIKQYEALLGVDPIQELISLLAQRKREIDSEKIEKEKGEKRKLGLEEKREKIITSLNKDLIKLNIEIA